MMLNTLLLVLALVAPPGGPKDPCGLLSAAELQTLTPNVRIATGVPKTITGMGFACEYAWGTGGNVQTGKSFLNVIVNEASKMFPGMDAATVKQAIVIGKNATPIPGIGEAASFVSNAPIRADATAYVKGYILEITFESINSRAQKDQLIALLKTAAGRL